MTPTTLAHLTRASQEQDAFIVSIAAGDLRELLGAYWVGDTDVAISATKSMMWADRLQKELHVVMEAIKVVQADVSRFRSAAETVHRNAIAALPVPEAPTVQEDIT